jgi:hypothetical protein
MACALGLKSPAGLERFCIGGNMKVYKVKQERVREIGIVAPR